MRSYRGGSFPGDAADHVRVVELVTADGAIRRVDAAHNPDLFWAVRGGKGDFGVMTGLTFELTPVVVFCPRVVAQSRSACSTAAA